MGRTLAEAHAENNKRRPGPDASLLEWVTYHRQCGKAYEAVSETDPDPERRALAAAWALIEYATGEDIVQKLYALYQEYLA